MNHKLNFLKCFACFGVVFIHISFPGVFGQIVAKVGAFAVPVFFMIAGYYAFGSDAKTIKRRLFKIIKIFIIAYIVFLIYSITNAYARSEDRINISAYFGWRLLIKAICFCTIDYAIPLWYLIAMSEAYITWYFVVKKRKEQVVLKLMPILFILQVLLISYCETMQLAWFWKTNYITRAMPWFLLGYYIHTYKNRFENLAVHKKISLAVFGGVITTIPVVFQLSLDFSSVGYIPYAFGVFVLALKNPEKNLCKPLEYIGNNLSLSLYILHVPMESVVSSCVALTGLETASGVWIWSRPIVVLAVTLFISWLLHKIGCTLKDKSLSIRCNR